MGLVTQFAEPGKDSANQPITANTELSFEIQKPRRGRPPSARLAVCRGWGLCSSLAPAIEIAVHQDDLTVNSF